MFAGGGWLEAPTLIGKVANNYELFLLVVGAFFAWPVRRRIEASLYVWRNRNWPNATQGAEAAKVSLATARAMAYSGALIFALAAMAANTHQAFIYFRF
jgi:hypothetical protein